MNEAKTESIKQELMQVAQAIKDGKINLDDCLVSCREVTKNGLGPELITQTAAGR